MKKPTLTLSLATKRLFLLMVITSLCKFVSAQDASNILPPSPQTQQFFKHFEFPANNANGAINYSIPLYEIKSGSLSLPVSLSYVSNGTKFTDQIGEIGLNWSINAGGRIARTIHGRPDETYSFPDSIPYMSNYNYIENDLSYLSLFDYGGYNDSQFDMYSYSFGNTSGKFIYKQYDETNAYNPKPYLIPEKPYKIDGPMTDTTWTIVDDKGITYIYQTRETYATSGSPSFGAVTARHLNYMISADKKDTIRIEYDYVYQSAPQVSTIGVVHDNNMVPEMYVNMLPSPYYQESIITTTDYYWIVTPKAIYFKGGKMTFGSGQIKVYDKKNNLIKQFTTTNGSKGILTELHCKDINASTVEKYSFEYYPFPYPTYAPDYLGYIKQYGAKLYHETIGFYFHYLAGGVFSYIGGYNKGVSGASYASDAGAMSGMLKKVTYPTGGSAEYSYELNTSLYGASGGMRLAEAKLTDNNGNVHYKTYKYGIYSEEGYGANSGFYVSDLVGPDPAATAYETRVFPSWTPTYMHSSTPPGQSYRKRVYTSSFLPEIAEAAQEVQAYPTVTVYDGTPSSNTGKTVYKYHYYGSQYQVGAYPPADWWRSAVSAYLYGYSDMEFDPQFSYRYHIYEFSPWKTNPLESTTVYKNTGSGYEIVKSIVNTYNDVVTRSFKGLHLSKIADLQTYIDVAALQIPMFLYDNYYITTGRQDLLSTTETLYAPAGNRITTTSYEYNTNNQVSKTTTTESKGGTNITTYTYANDYPSTQPYTAMVANNMLSQVIEQNNYKNLAIDANFLQGVKTDYKFWYNGSITGTPNNSIYPEKVWTRKLSTSNPYALTLHYQSYDESSGNILQLAKGEAAPTSYIWGYNKQYPVLEVKNATYSSLVSTLGSTVMNTLNDPTYDSDVRSAGATLRSAYPTALVTTISYKPLVGTTSTTDPKALTTYYEYDDYQRLMNVKDKDGHIIKHMDYNYKH